MSNLIEMNDKDYSHIQEAFNKVMIYSQNMDSIKSNDLFDQWFENKAYFRNRMNGLIYTHHEEFHFSLTPEVKKRKFEMFRDKIYNLSIPLWNFLYYISYEDFFNNKLSVDYKYAAENKIIKAGYKVVKAFKYFIEDKVELRKLQDMASQIIQEDKFHGKISISIHPLDYLSVSENTSGWRSCHALDGEYRSGNLNYMADKTTLICYISKSDSWDEKLPNFPEDVPWNSKTWRTFLYVSEDKSMMLASKGYPFDLDPALNALLEEVLPESGLLDYEPHTTWIPWSKTALDYFNGIDGGEISLSNKLIPMGHACLPMEDFVFSCENALFYNDILRYNTEFKYTYKVRNRFGRRTIQTSRRTKFNIGEPVKCLCCNNDVIEIPESPYCVDCEIEYGNCDNEDYIGYCERCGTRALTDNLYWVNDEYYYCEYCIDEHTYICNSCNGRITSEYANYDEDKEIYICDWCRGEDE